MQTKELNSRLSLVKFPSKNLRVLSTLSDKLKSIDYENILFYGTHSFDVLGEEFHYTIKETHIYIHIICT